ncbi:hypothetical protein VB711_10255 [Cronbergia sp. UHCC 0137]|uniref:hypothetical protein n=1 Tax=Cronbergia sp. UHCC 0137 TaxID=3110239 RepID=UPI002B207081|nr:hypothetical protein [Cronbergia sp. UHCC 0137]MEA5618213.1 hypothetical protein [Cronbergia sp. UHCC 0137]
MSSWVDARESDRQVIYKGSSVPNMQNLGKKIPETLICIRNEAKFLTLYELRIDRIY